MRKENLLSLFNKTSEDCEKIRFSVQIFEKKEKDIGRSNSKIIGENGLIFQIETVANKATEKIEAIKKIYSEIYEDDNENLSV